MDSYSSGRVIDLRNIRGICTIYKREEIPDFTANDLEVHGVANTDTGIYITATENFVVRIPAMVGISPKFWGVRIGYLLAGVVLSWMIQFGLAVVLTGG